MDIFSIYNYVYINNYICLYICIYIYSYIKNFLSGNEAFVSIFPEEKFFVKRS